MPNENGDSEKGEQNQLTTYMRQSAAAYLITLVVVFLAIFVVTRDLGHDTLRYTESGQVGDTIGGISAPFIGIASAILTFLAFYLQYKANDMQFKANQKNSLQFKLQQKVNEADKHENRILYLIQQNRAIAEGMMIGHAAAGARCFAVIFYEFRAAYTLIRSHLKDKDIPSRNIINAAFTIVYNGVGPNSDNLNREILASFPNIESVLSMLGDLSSMYRNEQTTEGHIAAFEGRHSCSVDRDSLTKLGYVPFDGHTHRLGQYFRNLFHLLTYVNSVDSDLITKEEKYELVKTLRSQLSSFEQILIYLNSISSYGAELDSEGFIETFKIIKNIPFPSVEFCGSPLANYPSIDFEWVEIMQRAKQSFS